MQRSNMINGHYTIRGTSVASEPAIRNSHEPEPTPDARLAARMARSTERDSGGRWTWDGDDLVSLVARGARHADA